MGIATLAELTFNVAQIEAVYIPAIKGESDYSFVVELLVNGVWTSMAPPFFGDEDSTNRTVCLPLGQSMIASAARIVVTTALLQTFTLTQPVVLARGSTVDVPRYVSVPVDRDTGYFCAIGGNFCDIWQQTQWIACVYLPELNSAMLPDLGFYAELRTIGIFHRDLRTLRIRRAGNDNEWSVDYWPYDGIPDHDYGLDYQKIDDVWDIFFRWTDSSLYWSANYSAG
ncbi:MAG: hypothetical protein U5K75_00095 [Ahrensia sp.]|nr:hypothetical protein [Ahrensia sp.]